MTSLTKNDLIFNPSLDTFNKGRSEYPLTILSGGNNTGKSLTLKWLKHLLGRETYMVGTNRFYHVYHFSTGLRNPREVDEFDNQFRSHFSQENYNYEQNYIDLNRIITNLGDKKREQLFNLCGELLGNTFTMKKVDIENDLSPRYIDMDGQNLSVGSTGARLLMTLLGICMDDRFNTILIDEPELGLSPKIQGIFSDFLQNEKERSVNFPHLKRIFIATHSHLFLSRSDIKSNFIVLKEGNYINLQQVTTITDFHRLQFNMLGNTLEKMFFPSAIVIVEGKTDHSYLQKLVELHMPGRCVTVIPSEGDVKRKLHGLREAFGDIQKSPFRSRLFVVLDKVHQHGLIEELEKLGVLSSNIIAWKKNGIEFYYPPELLAEIFACSIRDLENMEITEDIVRLNGIEKKKADVATSIIKAINNTTLLPSDIENCFLKLIGNAIA